MTPYDAPDSGHMLMADVPTLRRAAPNVQATAPDWSYKTVAPDAGAPALSAAHLQTQRSENGTVALATFTPAALGGEVHATTSDGFGCHLRYDLPAPLARRRPSLAAEMFGLLALNGHWLHGVVRSRSCLVFRCRSAACSVDPLFSSAVDLNATTTFGRIELAGNFSAGDLVIPMLATTAGDVLDDIDLQLQGGHLVVPSFGRPLLNAMLYASL